MVDQFEQRPEDTDSAQSVEVLPLNEDAGRASYPVRLRVILLLSLICWALLIAGVVWLLH